VVTDPYVLAAPSGLGLDAVADPDADLPPDKRDVVTAVFASISSSQLSRRFERWYQGRFSLDTVSSHSGRSYEVALSLVRAGLGVCLVPAFAGA